MTTIPKTMDIDPFYRYKRELVQVIHTRKKGGQTQIVNIQSIAHSIDRDPSILRKYLSKKLGMAVSKTFVFSGTHRAGVIDDIIEEYIEKHVLCRVCYNPETGGGVCKACGKACRKSL